MGQEVSLKLSLLGAPPGVRADSTRFHLRFLVQLVVELTDDHSAEEAMGLNYGETEERRCCDVGEERDSRRGAGGCRQRLGRPIPPRSKEEERTAEMHS